jgi:hypothetical protein
MGILKKYNNKKQTKKTNKKKQQKRNPFPHYKSSIKSSIKILNKN